MSVFERGGQPRRRLGPIHKLISIRARRQTLAGEERASSFRKKDSHNNKDARHKKKKNWQGEKGRVRGINKKTSALLTQAAPVAPRSVAATRTKAPPGDTSTLISLAWLACLRGLKKDPRRDKLPKKSDDARHDARHATETKKIKTPN